MSIRARFMVATAGLMLGALFFVPIWRIDLVAPQYPEGLGMLIRINTVSGRGPTDLANINNLNHYIGMKPITPEAIPELAIMPWIAGALIVLGLLAAAIGRRKVVIGWIASVVALATAGLIDFWRWGYDYGHNLDAETAIIKVPGMTYQPPVIGTKQLLNFTASSWPDSGAIVAAVALVLAVASLFVGRQASSHSNRGFRAVAVTRQNAA